MEAGSQISPILELRYQPLLHHSVFRYSYLRLTFFMSLEKGLQKMRNADAYNGYIN